MFLQIFLSQVCMGTTSFVPHGTLTCISGSSGRNHSCANWQRGVFCSFTESISRCVLSQVIAVGSGKEDDKGNIVKPNLNKGDTVLYSRYSGAEFTGQDDKQYIVIRESDVLAAVA